MKSVASTDGDESDPDDPTGELIRRFRAGEKEVLRELLSHHSRWIQREVSRNLSGIVRQSDDTSGVVSEVMLRVLRAKELRFTCGGEFRSLMVQVVQSTIYSLAAKYNAQKRNRKREQQWSTEGIGLDANAIAHSGGPVSRAAKRETSEVLRLAIDLLDLPTRYLIHLRFERGMLWDEIGAEIGLAPDTARRRFDRALKRLSNMTVQIQRGKTQAALELGSHPESDAEPASPRTRRHEENDTDKGDGDAPPRVAGRPRSRR